MIRMSMAPREYDRADLMFDVAGAGVTGTNREYDRGEMIVPVEAKDSGVHVDIYLFFFFKKNGAFIISTAYKYLFLANPSCTRSISYDSTVALVAISTS
jgi:hypothetical protein